MVKDITVLYSFEVILFYCLGDLVYHHNKIQIQIRDSNLFQYIVDTIGYKTINMTINNNSYNKNKNTEQYNDIITKQFQIQLIALQVLREVIYQNNENALRMSELGGFENILDFILWTANTFSIKRNEHSVELEQQIIESKDDLGYLTTIIESNSSINRPIPPPPSFVRPPSKELINLFQIIYTLCVPSSLPSSVTPPPSPTLSNINTINTNVNTNTNTNLQTPQIMNKQIISILVDLFNEDIRNIPQNVIARKRLREEIPDLQFYVLEFITKLLYYHNDMLIILSNFGLWDRIISTFYLLTPTTTDLFIGLRQQVLSFIEFTATLPNHVNNEECSKLLDLLQSNYLDFILVHQISKTLTNILNNNRSTTQSVLNNLKFFNVIDNVIEKQMSLKNNYESSDDTVNRELYYKSRKSVLTLLAYFLCDDTVRDVALVDSKLKTLLFASLYEVDMKEITLSILVLLMNIKPDDNNYSNTSKLVSHYLDLISRLQMENTNRFDYFELLKSLLFGIRQVIQLSSNYQIPTITSKKQKMIVEAGAFIKIVTILNVEPIKQRLPILCIEVLKTLTALMSKNAKNKVK